MIWLYIPAAAVLVGLVLLLWPGRTPPITNAEGHVIPGSVATLEKVRLNGVEQWVLMRGISARLPILLFLSGGPGGSELGWVRKYQAELERHFLVVVWEQRGAGKSYPLALLDRKRMTPEQYIQDGLELVDYLRRRFDQDKVFVMGHSWGSFLGVWLVQRKPEWFYAYVGVGQMVNTAQNDRMGYDHVLERARIQGNTALARKLERNGPPPYFGPMMPLRYLDYISPLTGYEHGLIVQAGGGGSVGGSMADMLNPPEFRLIDRIYALLGMVHTFKVVYSQLEGVDLVEQARELEVPVFMMVGRHDLNSMVPLSERYFQVLRAPQKELIWFEKSGHSPNYTGEAERFNRTVVERLLPLVTAKEGDLSWKPS